MAGRVKRGKENKIGEVGAPIQAGDGSQAEKDA
jgi:hypothetical protein